MEQRFASDKSIPWEDLGDGIKRKIMAFNETMMLTKV
jgi:hypothetical protein